MYAVGRLGSYISRGVYTVSGPFHPFGGAVDIIVVEQQDGSFKSSPWYVRFGKFQGVLKTKEKEKVVNISVNGVQADFHMYLDHKGEAYFLREVDGEEANSVFYPSISGEAADEANNDLPINERQGEMDSPLNDNMVNSLDHHVLREEMGFHDSRMGNSSRFGFQKLASSDKDCGVEMSSVNTKHIVETFTLDESGLLENYHLNSQTIREIDKLGVMNTDENAKGFISETTSLDPDSAQHNACPSMKLDEEQVFKEKGIVSTGSGVSEEESRADRLEAFVYRATSESSRVGLDNYGGKTDEALHVSCRGCVEVCGHAKTLHQTAEAISEVTSVQETSLLVAKEPLDNCGSFFNEAQILGSEGTFSNSIANSIASETYTQMATVDPINGFLKEDESCSSCTISDFNKSIYGVQDEENTRDEDNMSNLQCSSKPVGDSQEFMCDSVSTEVMTVSPSDGSEEEHLLFGDLDDFNHGEVKCMESISSDHMEKEDHPSVTPKGSEAVIESLNPNDESYSSPDKFVQENMPNDAEDFRQKSRIVSSVINIPRSTKVSGENVERMAESLPNMWPQMDNLDLDDPFHSLGHSLDSNSESSKWMQLRGSISSCLKSDADKDLVSQEQPTVEDAQISEDLKNVPASPAVGNLSKAVDASNGSWRVWPFSFKRSRSMKTTLPAQKTTRNFDAENTLESSTSMDGEIDVPVKKKKVRAITPTPEQLTSLNLKEGKNIVTFTFSTAMLGQQQVDARIYFWKWDARVVISDVDGTITKSDVLGQFMPLVGVDWSQTGVAHLFSDIKENGYQLLFLSARAIAQAYHTRQFLFNLKQDGKALPDGPVVISPDGLFPSLFREVVRRAPHEFKIACLEEIRALFPSDCNPFYAGFGNRDTDEISYLKVGIPKGKIFIINPKGKVVVNRCVDSKSYTELHAFVHDMFPPMSSSEQLEDFNSWNYWKLPPPAIDD